MKKRLIFIAQKIKKVSPFYTLSLIVALIFIIAPYIWPSLQMYKVYNHHNFWESLQLSCIIIYLSSCVLGAVLLIWVTILASVDICTDITSKKQKPFLDKQDKFLEWFTARSVLS